MTVSAASFEAQKLYTLGVANYLTCFKHHTMEVAVSQIVRHMNTRIAESE